MKKTPPPPPNIKNYFKPKVQNVTALQAGNGAATSETAVVISAKQHPQQEQQALGHDQDQPKCASDVVILDAGVKQVGDLPWLAWGCDLLLIIAC